MKPLTDQGWKGSDNIHSDVELVEGVLRNTTNLDFSASGKVRSRRGYVQKQPGAASNGYAFGKFLIYKSGGALMSYNVEVGVATVLFSVQGGRVGYATVNNVLYVSDGVDKWSITEAGVVSQWPVPAADDPTFDMRFLAPFPACARICSLNGRMFGMVGNVVVYSEPYAFGVYNPARNFFVAPSKVTVIHANQDTLFIGSSVLDAVTGIGTDGMARKTVMGIQIPDALPAFDDETGLSYFPTTRGLMVIPASGSEVSLIGSDMFAVRPMAYACAGIIKRDGVTQVVSTAVPDTTYMTEHPLVSTDYLRSEEIRKELQNAI